MTTDHELDVEAAEMDLRRAERAYAEACRERDRLDRLYREAVEDVQSTARSVTRLATLLARIKGAP